jgi:hypothetical protein
MDLAQLLTSFLNPDNDIRNQAVEFYFSIERSNPIETLLLLTLLLESSHQSFVLLEAVLRIRRLLLSNEIPGPILVDVQSRLLQYIQNPKAIVEVVAAIIASINDYLNFRGAETVCEWPRVETVLQELIVSNFAVVMPFFIGLVHREPSIELVNFVSSVFEALHEPDFLSIERLVEFQFAFLIRRPDFLGENLTPTLNRFSALPDQHLTRPLAELSELIQYHHALISSELVVQLVDFLLGVIMCDERSELSRIHCLFQLIQMVEKSAKFREIITNIHTDTITMLVCCLSNPLELPALYHEAEFAFDTLAYDVGIPATVWEEDVKLLMRANDYVCSFFLTFIHIDITIESMLLYLNSDDEIVLTNAIRALMSVIHDPEMDKPEIWPVIAVAVCEGLTTPSFKHFLVPLEVLVRLGHLSQEQMADAFAFLGQVFGSCPDPQILPVCAIIGRVLRIDEDTALELMQTALPFSKSNTECFLKVISNCLPFLSLEPVLEVFSSLKLLSKRVLTSRAFLDILHALGIHFGPFVGPIMRRLTELLACPISLEPIHFDEIDGTDQQIGVIKSNGSYLAYSLQAVRDLIRLVELSCELLGSCWDQMKDSLLPLSDVFLVIARSALQNRNCQGVTFVVYDLLVRFVDRFGPAVSFVTMLIEELYSISSFHRRWVDLVDHRCRPRSCPKRSSRIRFYVTVPGPQSGHCGFDRVTYDSVISHMRSVFQVGISQFPELALELFTALQDTIPYFTDSSSPAHIRGLLAFIWTDMVSKIAGFSPPETFLGDLHNLLGAGDSFLQVVAMNCMTDFICHRNMVDVLQVLEPLAVVAQEGCLDVAQAAVHSFGRLLDVFFEQLNVSEYFVTYLGLARGVLDKFPSELVGELYTQIAKLGCKLSDRDTENFHT